MFPRAVARPRRRGANYVAGPRVAAYERALTRARTKGALAVLKAKGQRTGGVPMGSMVADGGMLAVNEAKRAAVERARVLRGEGKSLRAIAVMLDAEGHRPRGKRWHVETLSRMLRA